MSLQCRSIIYSREMESYASVKMIFIPMLSAEDTTAQYCFSWCFSIVSDGYDVINSELKARNPVDAFYEV